MLLLFLEVSYNVQMSQGIYEHNKCIVSYILPSVYVFELFIPSEHLVQHKEAVSTHKQALIHDQFKLHIQHYTLLKHFTSKALEKQWPHFLEKP